MADSYRDRLVRDDLGRHPLTRPMIYSGQDSGPVRINIRPEGYSYPTYDNWESVPKDVKTRYNNYTLGPIFPEGREINAQDSTGSFTKIGYLKDDNDFDLPDIDMFALPSTGSPDDPESSGPDEARGEPGPTEGVEIPEEEEADPSIRPETTDSPISGSIDEGAGAPAENAPPKGTIVDQVENPDPKKSVDTSRPSSPSKIMGDGEFASSKPSAVGKFIRGVPRDVYAGVFRATREFNQFLGVEPILQAISDLEAVRSLVPEGARNPPEPTGTASSLVQEVSRFATGAVATSPVLKAFGVVNQAARLGLSGMVSDFAFMDPQEEGPAEFLRDYGELDDPALEAVRGAIVDAFATSKDYTELENRMRQSLGGYISGEMLGLAVSAAGAAFKALKNSAYLPESVKRRVLDQANRSAARQNAKYPDGASPVGAGVDPVDTFDKFIESMAQVIKNSEISANGFYSALEKNMQPFTGNNYHASQWKGIIKNFNKSGVREAEIKWSGVLDWLDDKKGKISGQEVLDEIKSRLPIISYRDHKMDNVYVPIEGYDRSINGENMKELTRKLTEADIEKNGPLVIPDLSDESFHKIGLITYGNDEAHRRFNRFVDGFLNVPASHLRVHDNAVNFLVQDLIDYGIEPSKAEEIRHILSNSVKNAPIPKDGTAKVKNIINLISNNPGSFDHASDMSYRTIGVKLNPEDVGLEVKKSVKPSYELTHGERDARSLVNNSIEDMEIATIKQIADLGFSSQDQYDEYVSQVKEYFEDAIENPGPMPFLNRVNQILKYLGATPIKGSSLVTKKNTPYTEPLLEFAEYSYHGRQIDEQIYNLPEEVRESLVDSYVNAKTPTGYKEHVYTWDNNPPHLTTRDDHFKGDNIIANAISYEVTGHNGKKYLFIDEIQSTPFQSMTPEERAKYPLSSNWIDVIAKHMVREAAERDLDGIVFSTSQMMRDQHGERSGKELFEFVYDKRLPSVLKKLTGNKQAIPIATYSGPSRELITEAGRDYQAYLDYEGIEDIYTYAADFDAEVREAFTVRNPTVLSVQLTPEVKRKILTEGTPLWGAGIGASSFLANDESFTGEEYQEASLFGEVLSHALKYVEPKRAPLSTAKKVPKPVVDFDSFRSSTSVSNSFRDYAHTFGGYEAGQKAVEEEKLASLTGTSVSTIRRVNGGKIDDSLLHSQIQMVNDSVRQVDHFAKVASEDPTVSNLAKWVSQWRTHRAVVETISGNYRKADEELAKFRNPTGSVREQEILDEIGGKGFAEYSLGLYNELRGVQARSTFLRTSLWTRTKDGVYAAWINGLLSNPATQVVNLLSTTAFMGFRTIERTIAGAIPGGDITMAEGPMMAAGFIHGMIDTMKLGYMFTTENMFRDAPTKEYADFRERLGNLGFDDAFKKIEANEKYNVISGAAFGQEGVLGAGIDMLGWGLTWPGRSLQITDAVTKSIAYRGELYALAYRHANRVYKETSDMAKASAAFDNAIKFPSETMHRAAVNEARVVTFTKELGELGQSVEGAFNNLFLGRFFLPFIRTPANLLKQGFRRTAGINLLTPSMWADLRAGGTRRQEAIAALGVSSSLASVAAYMASEGLLTGSVDFDKRSYYQQMSLTGKQRYSIKVGEDYYSFGRFEPLATPLAIWADAYEVMSMIQDQDDLDLVANAAVASVVEVVREKAFLQSFSGLADIVFPNDPSNVSSLLEREVGRQASSLVPNVVSKSGPVFEMLGVFDNDPSIRVTDVDESEFERSLPGVQTFYRVLNEVIARTPGLSSSLPPLRGAFGEEIPRGTDSLADLYSPFYYSEGKYSKIGKELERLGTYIALPPRDYMGVKLSPRQNDRLNVIRANEVIIGGRSFKEHLEYMMESSMYLNLPTDDLRVMEIKNEVSDFNEIAMGMLIAEDPEIARKAEQLEKELYGVE